MRTDYKTWFSIKLLNGFFNHGLFTDCFILPANDTRQQFFTGTNWLQKFIGDTLYVLIKSKSNNKPAIVVPSEKFFRFYLFTNNANFYNYTNIDSRIGKGYVLYLSNFAGNKVDSILNLSSSTGTYDNNTTYYPGDLVANGGEVYECIVKSENNAPGDTGFWLKRNDRQFVSSADVLPLSSANYRYRFSDDIIQFNATISGFRVDGNTLTEYIASTSGQTFPKPLKDIQVDLSTLKAGRYKIILNAIKASDNSLIHIEEIFYYDVDINQNKALAVIEIFNCIAEGTDYAFQNDDAAHKDEILETIYTINFANRIAWWKYIAKEETFPGIQTAIGGLSFANPDVDHKKIFAANKPLPFVKQYDYAAFSVSGTSPPKQIPWPSPTVLKCEINNGTINKFFTEIYLNY